MVFSFRGLFSIVVFVFTLLNGIDSYAQHVECKDAPLPEGYVITRIFTLAACEVNGPNNAFEYQFPTSGLSACSNRFPERTVLACKPTPASKDCPEGGYLILDPISCAATVPKAPGLELMSTCAPVPGLGSGWFLVAEKMDASCSLSPQRSGRDQEKATRGSNLNTYQTRRVFRKITSSPASKTISKCTSGSVYPGGFWVVTDRYTSENCSPSSDPLKPNTEMLRLLPNDNSAGHIAICLGSPVPSGKYAYEVVKLPGNQGAARRTFHTDACGKDTSDPNTMAIFWFPHLAL